MENDSSGNIHEFQLSGWNRGLLVDEAYSLRRKRMNITSLCLRQLQYTVRQNVKLRLFSYGDEQGKIFY